MKVLITGGSGLLGKSLIEIAPDMDEIEIALTWNSNNTATTSFDTWYRMDVRDRQQVRERFEVFKPDVVIHCAAIGSVDYAEHHYSEVHGVNVAGTAIMTDAANEYDAKIIYVSTNAVYSGDNPPYSEDAPLQPVNAYGKLKLQAEQYVRTMAVNWMIVRPFLLFGWPYQGGRNNWANTIVKYLDNGKRFKLVDDYYWMPTYAMDCADAIWKLLFQYPESNEVFNVATDERVTLYQFGLKVCEVFDLDSNLLEPVGSDAFPSLAPRPKDTTYNLDKLHEAGIVLGDIMTGLIEMREVGG